MQKFWTETIADIETNIFSTSIKYSDYISRKTFLGGRRFSFKGHEYQKYLCDLIQERKGYTFSILKPSQIGLSEIVYRILLTRMKLKGNQGVLLSMPTKVFSQQVLKTRIDAIIDSSPDLKKAINRDINSASVKAFTNNSTIYGLSGRSDKGKTSLLNVPAHVVCLDEIDRQDDTITSSYVTRTRHAGEDTIVINLSTPTAKDIGIHAEIKICGEIHTAVIRCLHCGNEFDPDFYTNVKLPGYDEPTLKDISRDFISEQQIRTAYLQCPECLNKLAEEDKQLAWKKEFNKNKDPKRLGIILSPFACSAFITPTMLVEPYLTMKDPVEFQNQILGKTAEVSSSQIPSERLNIITRPDDLDGMRVIGCDMGKQVYLLSGVIQGHEIIIDTAEVMSILKLEEYIDNKFKYGRIGAAVFDSAPEISTVYRMVAKHSQVFSARYVVDPSPTEAQSFFSLKEKDKYGEVVRLLNINHPFAFENIYENIERYQFVDGAYTNTIKQHLTSMRRVRDIDSELFTYKWIKSNGIDHFHHSLAYLTIASKVIQENLVTIPALPISVRRVRQKKPKDRNIRLLRN